MLIILADENITLVDTLFSQLGKLVTMPGRDIRSRHLVGVDILLVRSVTKVDSDLLQGSTVKFVGSCTIGIDHLDVSYLDRVGINWANAPGCNANAVVQYVFSAMAMLAPNWANSVIGIIGCGNVGSRLLHCLRAMGVKCLCYDPLIKQDKPELTTLDEVLTADIISCHTSLTTMGPFPTHHLISEYELAQLKSGALLINTSRGSVIDNAALMRSLEHPHSFKVALKVALDVWANEPDINPRLLEKVDIGTPHIAGHSLEGKQQGSVQVYRALSQYLKVNVVNPTGLLPHRQEKILRFDKESNIDAQRNAILLAAYDINDDDRQLRYGCSRRRESVSTVFDQLRKHYPVRRDYSHCLLPAWFDKDRHHHFLKALGFANT